MAAAPSCTRFPIAPFAGLLLGTASDGGDRFALRAATVVMLLALKSTLFKLTTRVCRS